MFILQGVAQGCTVCTNDMILIAVVEAAKQGVTPREDTVSELMVADDPVGISRTLVGLQKQIEKTLEYTREWRVTANVKMCAVVYVKKIR